MLPKQDDSSRELTDRYDREAVAYRELWAPILRVAGLGLLREFAGAPIRRILDVGTGVGSLLPDLQTAFPAAFVMGVDRSRGMLALAPPGIPRAVMDATQLAIPSGSVDLVLLIFVLFHLERPVDGLREAYRVLRQGGRVASVTWAGEFESKATRIWTECLNAHDATKADPATETRHDPVNTPQKMETILRAAGFTSVRCWADDLVSSIDLEHLIRLKTSLGPPKLRFDSLAPLAQDACVMGARARMEWLAPEDFLSRDRIVYAVASV